MTHLKYFTYYAAQAHAMTDAQLYKVIISPQSTNPDNVTTFKPFLNHEARNEIIKRWCKEHGFNEPAD